MHSRFRSVTHVFGEDFVSVIKANVTPCKGRELVVELLPGSHNWKEFYEQYSLNIAGLVPNPHVKDKSQMTVNHCWRFIKRSDLPLYDDKCGDSWCAKEISGETYDKSDNDCVLLLKHLVNSESLSQPPLIVLPEAFRSRLQQPVKVLPRNLLADRAKKEFLRTAELVEQDPWLLTKAANALRGWDANERQSWPPVPLPDWWFSTEGRKVGVVPNPEGWEKYAPGPVRNVTVAPAPPAPVPGEPKRRGRKRKADKQGMEGQSGADAEVYEGKAAVSGASVAVPAPPKEDLQDMIAGRGSEGVMEEEKVPVMPAFPTRSTFAGRTRTGTQQYQEQWDSRRTAYYSSVPSTFWKDHFERQYWTLCSSLKDPEGAMKQFLEDIGFKPLPRPPAALPNEPSASAKVQGKPKAKAAPKRGHPHRKPACKAVAKPKPKGRPRGKKAQHINET
ncbi:unnamed protein product [Durusdinium trenchii]|uniref:Uncharacterized protein n=1 Tax=Durusdinium trenchii TaxID=1381693 RepID=A0ABP0N166_9DINO